MPYHFAAPEDPSPPRSDDCCLIATTRQIYYGKTKRKRFEEFNGSHQGDHHHYFRKHRRVCRNAKNQQNSTGAFLFLEDHLQMIAHRDLWNDDAEVVRKALENLADLCFTPAADTNKAHSSNSCRCHEQEIIEERHVIAPVRTPCCDDNRKLMVNTACHVAIIKAMERFGKWQAIQAAGCRALQNLSSSVPPEELEETESVMKDNAMMITDDEMDCSEAFPEEEGVRRNFNNNDDDAEEDYIQCIADCGGIRMLVSAMSKHLACRYVQLSACGALYNLSLGGDKSSSGGGGGSSIRNTIMDCGGQEALRNTIQEHRRDGTIQNLACQVLRCLDQNY